MEETIYDIAIIGCGPGGIATAVEAIGLGVRKVALLEKSDELNSTIRKFYKDNKRVDKDYRGKEIELNGSIRFMDGTKETTLDLFDELVSNHDRIEVKFKTEVEGITQKDGFFEISATNGTVTKSKFIVISIGKMGQPNKPAYAIPAEIRAKVNFNANSVVDGEELLIVGGGNSAVEYACELSKTNKVLLNYRRSEFARINDINAEQLKDALASGRLVSKLGIDITGLENDGGRVKANFTDGTSASFDRAIYAIGGVSPADFLKRCGLNIDENGVPLVSDLHESSREGVFVAGDILYRNGGSIAMALNHGFKIGGHIAERLGYSCVVNYK